MRLSSTIGHLLRAIALSAICLACQSGPDFLQCSVNGKLHPEGLDALPFRFGWTMPVERGWKAQSAYRILVASRPALLEANQADLWDSGKVGSGQSQNVPFAGEVPPSSTTVYWKVRVWNAAGTPSRWSTVQSFSTGIIHPEEWEAQWISSRDHTVSSERGYFGTYAQKEDKNPGDTAAVYMRRAFSLEELPDHALIHLSGLGYYELYLNGRKVGDHVLDPAFSDYQQTVYYQTYRIDSLLRPGRNVLGVILGNGFFNSPTQDLFMMDQAHWKTPPKLLLQMEGRYADGSRETLVSDAQWRWSTGPITWNSIRGGETLDARRTQPGWTQPGFDDKSWLPVAVVPPPSGKLRSQQMPPLRVSRSLPPVNSWSPGPGLQVFDFGENLTGWAEVTLDACRPGQKLRFFFNEALLPDSTLDKAHSSGHTRGRFQEGRYICGGSGDRFEPRFTYHGFRYLQIEGLDRPIPPERVVAKSVHTDLESRGHFSCSDTLLNHLQAAVRRTLLNAIHSMPGEEPTREKMGWTFDAGMVTMESYLYNFKAESAYRKYLQDLIDGQEPNGHIPPIVPTNGWGWLEPSSGKPVLYDDPWWGSTIFFVTRTLFEWTADTSILEKAYDPMRRYLAFVGSTADEQLLVHWSLGDWLDQRQWAKGWGPGLSPIVQTSTAAYFWMAREMTRTASILGKAKEAEQFRSLAEKIKAGFNRNFLDPESGWYADSSQTAQVLPLYIDLVPDRSREMVEARLLDAIRWNDGHTSVGFVGVQPLLKYLSENGHRQLAFEMVRKEESPGWLHMLRNGPRSTLGENLHAEGYGTGHHPFGTCIGHWFYQYLSGIQPGLEPGWQQFRIAPGVVRGLDRVEAEVEVPYGRIVSGWEQQGGQLSLKIGVPWNCGARVQLPEGYRLETTGQGVSASPGANGTIVVGPGDHTLGLITRRK